MTLATFVLDKIKGYVLTAILGGAILYLLLWLIFSLQGQFWIWFWLAVTLIMVTMQFLYGTLIVPLFNKLKPLEDGELKQAIQDYAAKVDFPLQNIYVMDGSRRSTKANAYFMGFGKMKRIVLYDTLVEKFSVEELVAVFAHEVGHYKRRHIFSSFALGVVQMGLMLYLFSLLIFSPQLSQALGASQPGIHLNLLAVMILYSPFSQVLGFFSNQLSRKFEYQADRYARETASGEDLGSALKKMNEQHLSNLTPHPFNVAVRYSHPTLLQRLEALEA